MPGDARDALRPIASLLSKSEKARQKVAPGTWQHTMLGDNIRALRIGMDLIAGEAVDLTREELEDASTAFASMIGRTEKSQAMFQPGTSQHSLQRNRLDALRIGAAFVERELTSR